jgi:hypothetical protein
MTIFHSNIDVRLRSTIKVGTSTLIQEKVK